MNQEEVTSLENCYPFSLTSDDKYVYWADWGRQGIMRASLTDPKDIIKLVHTPHSIGEREEHFGVYGLAKLTKENPVDENSCKDKNGNAPNYEDMMPQNPTKNPQLETKEKTEGTEIKEVPNASSDNTESINKQDSQIKEAEEHKKNPVVDEKEPELEVDAGSSEHSEEIDLEEDSIIIKDRIVMNLEHMNLQPQGDAPSEESKEEVSFESVEVVTGVNNGKTQTDLLASESMYTLPPTKR